VAAARKLLRKQERVAARAFLVEGPHAVAEVLDSTSYAVRELFVTAAAADRETALLRTAAARDVPVVLVDDRVARSLGDTETPQGIVAVVDQPRHRLDEVLRGRPRLLAMLCGVADPGNAGTVIRTADAAGADAVLLTRGSTDPYSGKCVRSSAGSLFHLPVVTGLSAVPSIDACREAGLTVLATTLEGDPVDELDDVLARPVAWLFGNEAHGLDSDAAAAADRVVRVPIHGRAESLNLAAAAAVCLYATARAQRAR
jgi:TrmH family RNA methyltransferase